jgi:hypothetical protein
MNPAKLVLLAIFAPRFFADMPPRGAGRYLASAQKYSHFYCHAPIERKVVGRRRAYAAARWFALVLDWGRVTDSVGIRWRIASLPNDGVMPRCEATSA